MKRSEELVIVSGVDCHVSLRVVSHLQSRRKRKLVVAIQKSMNLSLLRDRLPQRGSSREVGALFLMGLEDGRLKVQGEVMRRIGS